jgi:hypothetical protein
MKVNINFWPIDDFDFICNFSFILRGFLFVNFLPLL